MSVTTDFLKLHFIVLIWGFTAVLGLLITLPPIETVFYRTLIASIVLGLVLVIRKESFLIDVRSLIKILGTGVIIALHWILFFAAARVSTASVCLAGMATCAFWTSILEPLVLKKKIKAFEIILSFVTIVGLYIVFKFEFDNMLGLIMALISAFLAAVFTIINARLVGHNSHYIITFYEMIGACIGTLLFFPIYIFFFNESVNLQFGMSWSDFLWLLILAVVCTVYAFAVSIELMKRISVFAMNLTVNMEPVYGIILAYLVFGEKERMSMGFYLGTLVILLSVLAYPLLNRWNSRRSFKKGIV